MSFVTPKSKLSQRQIEGHENAISNRREHPIFVFSVGGARDLWNCVEELRNNHLIDYYTLFFFCLVAQTYNAKMSEKCGLFPRSV